MTVDVPTKLQINLLETLEAGICFGIALVKYNPVKLFSVPNDNCCLGTKCEGLLCQPTANMRRTCEHINVLKCF